MDVLSGFPVGHPSCRGVQPVALSHVCATDGSKCATSNFQVLPLFLTVYTENN